MNLLLLGPERLVLVAGPVVLGLGHPVALGDGLEPVLANVGAAVEVELGVVEELAGLGDVALVVGLLLGGGLLADLVVLVGGEAGGDIGAAGVDGALLEVLAAAGAVVVLVGLGGEEVHVEDTGGDGLALGGLLGDGGGSRGLLATEGTEGLGGGGSGEDKSGSVLHFRDIIILFDSGECVRRLLSVAEEQFAGNKLITWRAKSWTFGIFRSIG